jgi:hypothetical protein
MSDFIAGERFSRAVLAQWAGFKYQGLTRGRYIKGTYIRVHFRGYGF